MSQTTHIYSQQTLFIDVIVPLSLPNTFTYRVPLELNDAVSLGKRAIVQFGKSKFYTAIIVKVHNQAPTEYTAKYVESVIDETSIITTKQLELWEWISYYYLSHIGDVMNAALPSGLKLSSTSHITLNPNFSLEESEYDYFTEREHLILDALQTQSSLSFEDVSNMLTLKSVQAFINGLIKKGAIVIYEEIKDKYKPKLVSYLGINSALLNNELTLKETLDRLEKKSI